MTLTWYCWLSLTFSCPCPMFGSKETKMPTTRKATRIITISELERLFLADTPPLDKALKTSSFIFTHLRMYEFILNLSALKSATFVPEKFPQSAQIPAKCAVHSEGHLSFNGKFSGQEKWRCPVSMVWQRPIRKIRHRNRSFCYLYRLISSFQDPPEFFPQV